MTNRKNVTHITVRQEHPNPDLRHFAAHMTEWLESVRKHTFKAQWYFERMLSGELDGTAEADARRAIFEAFAHLEAAREDCQRAIEGES